MSCVNMWIKLFLLVNVGRALRSFTNVWKVFYVALLFG